MTPDAAMALQREAGNSAVVSLLERDGVAAHIRGNRHPSKQERSLQRDVLKPADDPKGYTQPGGVKDVAKSGMTRVEVTGLKYGVKGGHQTSYKSSKERTSVEKQMTKESPNNTAVVVMPDKVDANRSTQVILHVHGWGFRDIDPYAGYAVATGKPTGAQGAPGTVRDVDQEHWAQQIGAVGKERAARSVAGPQIVAVLAQGRGMSDFGNVPTFDYIQDVFSKAGGDLAKITTYNIILSAHSGGGDKQVAPKVNAGDAPGTDRSKLPAPAPGHAPKQASDLVILFDAEGMSSVMTWIEGEITKLAAATKGAADPAAEAAILAAPKFRGYFASPGSYWAPPFHDASKRLGRHWRRCPRNGVAATARNRSAPATSSGSSR